MFSVVGVEVDIERLALVHDIEGGGGGWGVVQLGVLDAWVHEAVVDGPAGLTIE